MKKFQKMINHIQKKSECDKNYLKKGGIVYPGIRLINFLNNYY